jgi:hypothetical protein
MIDFMTSPEGYGAIARLTLPGTLAIHRSRSRARRWFARNPGLHATRKQRKRTAPTMCDDDPGAAVTSTQYGFYSNPKNREIEIPD